MRVLKVHEYYIRAGGEDTVFQAEKSLLLSRGHDVIDYLEFNKKINSMNPASVALQTIWSAPSYRAIKQALQNTKPDVVHFHNTFPLVSPSAYYACQDMGIPVVQTLDNQRLICPAASFYRDGKLCLDCLHKTPPWPAVLHACYHDSTLHSSVVASMLTFHRWLGTWQSKVDIYLCSTNFYRDLFVEAGLPPEKIVVMPHFVASHYDAGLQRPDVDYALFVGRLDPEKGVRTLLHAWRDLDIPLKIRGDGRITQWAHEFVKQHEMNHVQFVDRLSESELSNLIQNARFLVIPSEGYYETFGMVIIEAYSRNVAVIASRIGVAPELVSDQQTGLLFEAGNAQDLAAKARWMWDHPSQIKAMAAAGFNRYQERFTPEKCYETLIAVYETVVRAR